MPQAQILATEKASVADNYDNFFEVVLADTQELLDRVHKIRYQVYCVENRFEDPAENPGGYEIDAYDERSVQSLLIHRQSEEVAGTVRLILPSGDAAAPDFPIQNACANLRVWPEQLMPAASTAEISRFTMAKNFRRRVGDAQYANTGTQADKGAKRAGDRRSSPFIMLGLVRALVKMSEANNITHWCAIMDPPLLRLLSRIGGVHFIPLGPLVDYHGWRQPCYGRTSEIYAAFRKQCPDLWHAVAR